MYTIFNRHQNKVLATILIVAGLIILPDFLIPTIGTDILINIPLATLFVLIFNISSLTALILTYLLGFVLIALGLLIFPYNTMKLAKARIKAALRFITKRPELLIVLVIIFLIMFFFSQLAIDILSAKAQELLTEVGLNG